MQYPKPVMNRTELIQLGFTKSYLERVFLTGGQKVAWRMNPANKSSPVLYDTDALEQFRLREIEMEEKCRRHEI